MARTAIEIVEPVSSDTPAPKTARNGLQERFTLDEGYARAVLEVALASESGAAVHVDDSGVAIGVSMLDDLSHAAVEDAA